VFQIRFEWDQIAAGEEVHSYTVCENTCTVKNVIVFPVPSRMSLTKLSLAGNFYVIPGQ